MDERKFLEKVTLSTVFIRFFIGFGTGGTGTIVLGIVLLLTWAIVGDILSPTIYQTQNEYGATLSYRENLHPLFLSIVVLAVFLATLVSNLFYCTTTSTIEEKYVTKSTNLTQIFFGNLTILFLFLPLYLMVGENYGAQGIAFVAFAHAIFAALLTFLILEILSTHRYLLVSIYGGIFGIVLFLMILSVIGSKNPALVSFATLPFLLGSIGAGSAIAQMFYIWVQNIYNNDFLNIKKRFGNDYGKKESFSAEDFENL